MNRHNKECQHYFDDTNMHNVVAKVDSGIERDAPPPLGKNMFYMKTFGIFEPIKFISSTNKTLLIF